MIYRLFFRLVLQHVPSQRAHDLGIAVLRIYARIPGLLKLTNRLLRPPSRLRMRVFDLEFRSPLGLAAGVDKNSVAFDPLAALGFGSVEVGTATNRRQDPNPGKTVWRLPEERAILNWMGFPNDGAGIQAQRLARRHLYDYVLGVNIGKSRSVDLDHAVHDYREATRRLAPFAQYLALNVSSPNTPGLRSMQNLDHLEELVGGVRAELEVCGRQELPLLIKLGPDLSNEELVEIAAAAVGIGVDGIIAVNTTTDYDSLHVCREAIARHGNKGGVSGRPLKERSLEVLELLHDHVAGLPLISVGGIESADDVWERILAGAALVQVHTGFIYGGPLWPRRINRHLARRLEDSQWDSIEEAVGSGSGLSSFQAQQSPRPTLAA